MLSEGLGLQQKLKLTFAGRIGLHRWIKNENNCPQRLMKHLRTDGFEAGFVFRALMGLSRFSFLMNFNFIGLFNAGHLLNPEYCC